MSLNEKARELVLELYLGTEKSLWDISYLHGFFYLNIYSLSIFILIQFDSSKK
jgi:hypothetical protein